MYAEEINLLVWVIYTIGPSIFSNLLLVWMRVLQPETQRLTLALLENFPIVFWQYCEDKDIQTQAAFTRPYATSTPRNRITANFTAAVQNRLLTDKC